MVKIKWVMIIIKIIITDSQINLIIKEEEKIWVHHLLIREIAVLIVKINGIILTSKEIKDLLVKVIIIKITIEMSLCRMINM